MENRQEQTPSDEDVPSLSELGFPLPPLPEAGGEDIVQRVRDTPLSDAVLPRAAEDGTIGPT